MKFLTLPEASWAQPILSGARRALYIVLLLLPGTVIVLPLLWWLNRRALKRHESHTALSGLLARKAGLKEEDCRRSLPHNPKATGSNPITHDSLRFL
jgi:hypothetical protein